MSSATLAPFLGGAQFKCCIREDKLYNRWFTLKSTNLQIALLPLLPWRVPFCSPRNCQKPSFFCYLGWRRPARTQRSCSGTSTRECGTTPATSNQINGMSNATCTCLAAQINTATGHEPRSRCTCSPPSSTVRKTQSSAVDLELTPQLFADQKNRRRASHTGRGRRPNVPATGWSELLFTGTPLQRILPNRSKIKSAWHAGTTSL